jgi:CBS domain containing-hemolysin-like protein
MLSSFLLLAVLIALSSFFSGAEIAMFSVNQARVRSLRDEGRRGAAMLATMKGNPEKLLTTILVGNNVVNIWAAALATALALQLFGQAGIAYATGAMTCWCSSSARSRPRASRPPTRCASPSPSPRSSTSSPGRSSRSSSRWRR